MPTPPGREYRFACALLAGVLLSAAGTQAATFTVDSTADAVDEKPDGVCAVAGGGCTLRAAVMEANGLAGADLVLLPAGTIVLAIPPVPDSGGDFAAETGDLEITDAVTIRGAGRGLSIVDGASLDRVFDVAPFGGGFEVTIERLTVRGGSSPGGGGILNFGVLRLAHCEVTENRSDNSGGGGVNNGTGAQVTIDDCTITGNRESGPAGSGGGIANAGEAVIRHSLVDGNQAAWVGGGIWSGSGGSLLIEDSTVSNNQTLIPAAYLYYGGGGISNNASLTIRNTSIHGNSAVFAGGGGLHNVGTAAFLTNVTISGNGAATAGGGIWNNFSGGSVTLVNCTVAGNTAGTGAGGVDGVGGMPPSTTRFSATIVAANAGGNCAGVMTSWYPHHNLDSATSCGFTGPGDLSSTDPQLSPLADNGGPAMTHALAPTSPARDAVDPADCHDDLGDPLLFDARGAARPLDGGTGSALCDVGAYERFAGVDLIFADGFEGGTLGAWSSSATGGGDLTASAAAALAGTTTGLRALVDDTAGLYVQDDSPADEGRFRARFYFDPTTFDPGESSGHFRVRLFIAFEEGPTRRLVAVVLRRMGGVYALRGRTRLDDNSQADTPFVPITDGPHVVELAWQRASADAALDGRFRMWIDNVSVAEMTGLDNSLGAVDFVRLGALSVKAGAAGSLKFDQFVSRRQTWIGPE